MIRINEMNKIIIFLLFLSLFLFSGCIPYGYETESQKIIGKRSDANGKICEQIIRYNKKLKFIGIIGHDGFFSPGYVCYSRYSALTGESEYTIWALEHFPQLRWSRIEEAVPIPNSDRWITCEYKIQDINEVQVTLTIFSIKKGKIFRDTFSHVTRTPPRKAKTLFGFYIEYDKNLNHLTVHESDGVFQINTITGAINSEIKPSGR